MDPILEATSEKCRSRIAAVTVHSKGYFHFPLCLLAFRSDYKDRLQHVVSYCLCERAQPLNRTSTG
jgi:hypothetical protein